MTEKMNNKSKKLENYSNPNSHSLEVKSKQKSSNLEVLSEEALGSIWAGDLFMHLPYGTADRVFADPDLRRGRG